MANEAAEYIREVWDSLVHGKTNKKKKDEALKDINDFLGGYADSKVPQKPTLPDAPVYSRWEYDAPDDQKLHADAQKELASYKAQGEKGIEKEIEALREKYDAQAEEAERSHEQAKQETTKSYASAKQSTSDDMLKRGLARSSIAANKQAALGQSEASALASLAADYSRQVGELSEKINGLQAKRQEALNDFDLSYAAKLAERVNELKKERDDKMSEVLKYNNTLTQKEYEAQVDKTMKESDLYGEALSQREKEDALKKTGSGDYGAIYAAVAERLRSINKNDARDIVLNNPNVRASLDAAYYYKLYDEFCR